MVAFDTNVLIYACDQSEPHRQRTIGVAFESGNSERGAFRIEEIAVVIVNIHEAKTQLSRLVDRAAKGQPFVIAKAGKPLVKVSALDAPPAPQRLGFLTGEIAVPKDFDRMGQSGIAALFGIGA